MPGLAFSLGGCCPPVAAAHWFSRKPVLLLIEVMGDAGTIVERDLNIPGNRYKSVRSLWLEIHGVRYPEQASVQINYSDWVRYETKLPR
jgi:hypothetical protein